MLWCEYCSNVSKRHSANPWDNDFLFYFEEASSSPAFLVLPHFPCGMFVTGACSWIMAEQEQEQDHEQERPARGADLQELPAPCLLSKPFWFCPFPPLWLCAPSAWQPRPMARHMQHTSLDWAVWGWLHQPPPWWASQEMCTDGFWTADDSFVRSGSKWACRWPQFSKFWFELPCFSEQDIFTAIIKILIWLSKHRHGTGRKKVWKWMSFIILLAQLSGVHSWRAGALWWDHGLQPCWTKN